jgi:hypothetical protein
MCACAALALRMYVYVYASQRTSSASVRTALLACLLALFPASFYDPCLHVQAYMHAMHVKRVARVSDYRRVGACARPTGCCGCSVADLCYRIMSCRLS